MPKRFEGKSLYPSPQPDHGATEIRGWRGGKRHWLWAGNNPSNWAVYRLGAISMIMIEGVCY